MKRVFQKLPLFGLIGLLLIELVIPLIPVGNAYAASFTGQWVDENTIIIGSASGNHSTYTKQQDGKYVYSPGPPGGLIITGNDSCPDTITVSSGQSKGTVVLNQWKQNYPYGGATQCVKEYSGEAQPITLTDIANATIPPGGSPTTDPSTGTPALGCNGGGSLSFGGIINIVTNPLNWLFCGIVAGLVGVVQWVDGQINSQLAIGTSSSSSDQPNNIFAGSSGCAPGGACDSYHAAWSSFREIALGLMVIAALIVVIAQALGLELLDAYTIRKVLPRLLIVAVAITLSWQLMEFLVTLSNDLGYGVTNLITAPFSGSSSPTLHLNFGQSLATAILGGIGLGIAGLFGLLTFVGTAALALLVAYIVIVLRQVVVILLVIVAPVALVAYILPNTQRVYRFWWDTLIRALLMFPMISAIIAVGYVFSWATLQQGGSDLQYQVIGFVAYFAPYFMIPLTFRFAGAAMGGAGNFVNNRASGGFNYLGQKRRESAARHLQAGRAGKRWREGWGTFGGRMGVDRNGRPRSVSRYANRAFMWGVDSDEMIPGTIGARGGRLGRTLFGNYAAQAQDQIAQSTMEHVTKAAQAAQANGPLHHKAERALAGVWGQVDENGNGIGGAFNARTQNALRDAGFEDGRAPETYAEIQRMSQVLRANGDTDEISAAGDLENMAGFMGNLNKDPEMFRAGGNVQSVGALMLASSGRLGPAEQAQVLNRVRTASPHGESLAARLEKQTSAIGSRQRTEVRHGKGLYQDANGEYHSALENPASAKAVDNLMTAKMPELMGSKGETVDQYAPTWQHILRSGPAGGYTPETRTRRRIVNGTERDEPYTVQVPHWSNDQETARQQLFQLASQYSSSDPSAKTKALNVLDQMSAGHTGPGSSLREEFDARESRGYDPAVAGGGGGAGGPGGGAGGPGGGAGGPGGGAGGPGGGAGGPGGGPAPSDSRLKRNVRYVATTYSGIRLYSFQYLWSDQVYVGVMAQEILATHPEAVMRDHYGFYRVDYTVLGLKMVTIEEWQNLSADFSIRK